MALGLITPTFVADRYSRKKSHRILFILHQAVLTFTSSFSENFNVLIALNFLKGFLLSVLLLFVWLTSEEVSENRKLRITGFYIAGNAVGGMVGRVISSQVSHYKSWQFASNLLNLVSYFRHFIFYTRSKSQNFKPKKESLKTLIEPNFKLITHPKLLPFYITGFLLLGTFL